MLSLMAMIYSFLLLYSSPLYNYHVLVDICLISSQANTLKVINGEGNATHFNILFWEILWTEEPGGLQSMELQKNWT